MTDIDRAQSIFMASSKDKLFVVRKYIRAADAAQAIRKEKDTPVHDVWVDDEWKKGNALKLAETMGFIPEKKHETS
jgi:hypothetical protein